jgi:hypothetical protein
MDNTEESFVILYHNNDDDDDDDDDNNNNNNNNNNLISVFQKLNENSRGTARNSNATDQLESAATFQSPASVLGFGSADAHDFYSTFYGYQPFILNSRGK